MEFGPPRQEEDDDEELEEARRAEAAEAQAKQETDERNWQERVAERFKLIFAEVENEEDDDEEDEDGSKKKKKKRAGGLFQRDETGADDTSKVEEKPQPPLVKPQETVPLDGVTPIEVPLHQPAEAETTIGVPYEESNEAVEQDEETAEAAEKQEPDNGVEPGLGDEAFVNSEEDRPEQDQPEQPDEEDEPDQTNPTTPVTPTSGSTSTASPTPTSTAGSGSNNQPPAPIGGGGSNMAPPSPNHLPNTANTGGNTINHINNYEIRPHNIAPAVVGSLIVDRLSRSRDKRLSEQAEAIKERVEELDKRHVVDKEAEAALRRRNTEEIESLARKRSGVGKETNKREQHKDNQPRKPEVVAEQPRTEKQPNTERSEWQQQAMRHVEQQREQAPHESSTRFEKDSSAAHEAQEHGGQQYERGIVRERYEDERFETLPNDAYDQASDRGGSGQLSDLSDDSFAGQQLADNSNKKAINHFEPIKLPNNQQQTMAKTAVVTGVATALVIIAIILLLSWLR